MRFEVNGRGRRENEYSVRKINRGTWCSVTGLDYSEEFGFLGRRVCMKDLIRLTDLQESGVYEIFHIADEISLGKYDDFFNGKSVILFFPAASIRTRVMFSAI